MLYCDRDHQKAGRRAHKSACNAVSKRRTVVESEEQKLRHHPGDFMTPPNPFINAVGRFWGTLDTRDYMRSRYYLFDGLNEIKSYDSAQAQLDHLMDMLRLCRSDNMGVRDRVLNKDQECYDFVKWWGTTGKESDYDWGNPDLTHLDVENADVFEPVVYLCGEYPDVSNCVAITLLKIKMLLELTALQKSAVEHKDLPGEIVFSIQKQIPRSLVIAGRKDVMEGTDLQPLIKRLTLQVKKLYRVVDERNAALWPKLLDPGMHLSAKPEAYSAGSVEEMQILVQCNYDSWMEIPGARDVMSNIIEYI